MSSMLRDVDNNSQKKLVNLDAVKSAIRAALINNKVNAGPIAMRNAWHMSGTFCKKSGTGGSNGACIRFAPEGTDPANKGLHIIHDLLIPVARQFPQVSHADLYCLAGCLVIEFLGGPRIPFRLGRTDSADGREGVQPGRLPDASQGADHLRAVFADRMGFTDEEIVALSGGHTLGRAHAVRSGYDGAWTSAPLRFDNEYFRNLVSCRFRRRQWDGPEQYEDEATGKIFMLPSDLALMRDASFRKHVKRFARSEPAFFDAFARAYGKLLALGCPEQCNPFSETAKVPPASPVDAASASFREYAMHGSVYDARKVRDAADVHQLEGTSGRSALHKAAFWGHDDMVRYLLTECRLDPNVQDDDGDTALHDAARFGHRQVILYLLDGRTDTTLRNKMGQTAAEVATAHNKPEIASLIENAAVPRSRL